MCVLQQSAGDLADTTESSSNAVVVASLQPVTAESGREAASVGQAGGDVNVETRNETASAAARRGDTEPVTTSLSTDDHRSRSSSHDNRQVGLYISTHY